MDEKDEEYPDSYVKREYFCPGEGRECPPDAIPVERERLNLAMSALEKKARKYAPEKDDKTGNTRCRYLLGTCYVITHSKPSNLQCDITIFAHTGSDLAEALKAMELSDGE